MKLKSDQNIQDIKTNIAQILTNCKALKHSLRIHPGIQRSARVKTLPSTNTTVEKAFDFDSCVKKINLRVLSLRSEKHLSSPMPSFSESQKQSVSQFELHSSSSQIEQIQVKKQKISDVKSSSQFPRLMQKYQKAYSPRNASCSQKFSILDRIERKKKQPDETEQIQSYHTMLGQRKKSDYLKRIFVIGMILKENVVREKKILQCRKKQRKLDNLKLKQISLMRCIKPSG